MTSTAASTADAARGYDAARLFETYGDQLYRFCLARLRSREEAEDALQNTFLRVYGALERGTTPRFEAAWLYKIAHNVCLSRRELTGRRALHEASADIDELPLAAPESHSDELIGLSDALTSMPKNLRDAILLREWQGLSQQEIAEALGTSVSAVETLIFRARRHLAAALEPTKVRKRSLARVLDAGWLYGGVRILLARCHGVLGAAGAAKLVAGAAVLAIGGTAVGVEVRAADTKRPASGVSTVSNAVDASFVATTIALFPTPTPTTPSRTSAAAPAPRAAAPASTPPATPQTPTETAPPAATPAAPAATATPTSAPTAAAPVPTTAIPALPVAPVVAAPIVALPAPPAVTVTVTVPAVPVPAVVAPAVTAPDVTVPLPAPPAVAVPG